MNCKRILRFYFSADGLNRALDNLILRCACDSYRGEGDACGQRIASLIGAKDALSRLWGYLDGVMKGFSPRERGVLEEYAAMRCGMSKLSEGEFRLVRRLAVRFFRRARSLGRYGDGIRLVNSYYALIRN